MSTGIDSLQDLLDELDDSRELVLPTGDAGDPALSAWRAAADDARAAYAAWCATPGALAHAAYEAAQDRADAAADSLRASVTVVAGPHRALPLAA